MSTLHALPFVCIKYRPRGVARENRLVGHVTMADTVLGCKARRNCFMKTRPLFKTTPLVTSEPKKRCGLATCTYVYAHAYTTKHVVLRSLKLLVRAHLLVYRRIDDICSVVPPARQ